MKWFITMQVLASCDHSCLAYPSVHLMSLGGGGWGIAELLNIFFLHFLIFSNTFSWLTLKHMNSDPFEQKSRYLATGKGTYKGGQFGVIVGLLSIPLRTGKISTSFLPRLMVGEIHKPLSIRRDKAP